MQWAVWGAGGVACALTSHHPPAELDYFIRDSQAKVVCGHASFSAMLRPLAMAAGAQYVEISDFSPISLPAIDLAAAPSLLLPLERRAMLIYTSGTTGKPKGSGFVIRLLRSGLEKIKLLSPTAGVVSTWKMMEAQINTMNGPWGWSAADRALCCQDEDEEIGSFFSLLHSCHAQTSSTCCRFIICMAL